MYELLFDSEKIESNLKKNSGRSYFRTIVDNKIQKMQRIKISLVEKANEEEVSTKVAIKEFLSTAKRIEGTE